MRTMSCILAAAALFLPVAASAGQPPPITAPAGGYSAESSYVGGAPVATRETWLENHIHDGQLKGALNDNDATQDFRQLHWIRQHAAQLSASTGGLTAYDQRDIDARLDGLHAQIEGQWGRH